MTPARFKIGDFSQLGQVSVRTLRLYDELGLIKPAETDRWTGYRYYTLDQLPRLNRILALKDLGLSLEQISHLLNNDLPAKQMRSMLKQKQSELEQALVDVQLQMQRVQARLRQVESEDAPPRYEVSLKRVESETIASLRLVVPHVEQMGVIRYDTLNELYNSLEAHHVKPLDPEIFIYHLPGYSDENIDMEVATAIEPGLLRNYPDGIGKLAVRQLDAFPTVASVIHQGNIRDIPLAIVAIYAWVGRNGFESAGPYREFHHGWRENRMNEPDLCNVTLEIQLPVTPLTPPS
jgi:DNA-binding transcriptional MerR regulator